ncbi:MAG: hypothetical protein ABIP51_20085 [Bacteroidia bacterium]
MFHRPDSIKDKLYIVTPIFNPQRYRSRWKLYKEFEKYILSYDEAHLVTIECTFGAREKVLVEQISDKHTVIYVNTKHEMWLKENLINKAIQYLPEDWKYVAWIDADTKFARPDIVGETLQKLQHYDFVQLFSHAVDLSPTYEILKSHSGFMYCYKNGIPNLHKRICLPYNEDDGSTGAYWHPGFAWACTRTAFDHVGGLIDWGVLGGGDMFMAYALIGRLKGKMMPTSLGKGGIAALEEWQNRCEKFIKRNVGYIDGLLLHYWHGKKVDRKYKDRGQILIETKFEPSIDLKKDWQGIYTLTDRSFELRDGIRDYFKQRNEDSIDI